MIVTIDMQDKMKKMSANIDDLKTKGAVNTNNGPTLKGVADFTGVLSAELGKSDEKMARMFERIEQVRRFESSKVH